MNANKLKIYIYENNLYQKVLEDCGCHTFKPSGGYLRCSLKDKTNNAIALLMNETLKIKDFANTNIDGNLFSLYSFANNITFGQTIRDIHKLLGLKYEYIKDIKIIDKTDPLAKFRNWREKSIKLINFDDLINYERSILDEYIPLLYYDWVIQDGIMEFTRNEFDIGFSSKYQRITIPHFHWSTGEIVGIIGRTVKEHCDLFYIPKYFPLIKYKKSHNL